MTRKPLALPLDKPTPRPRRVVVKAKPPYTKTLSVALGGGGARGLAHIVVLEALDDLGVKPQAIAGSSMGALVGAAYAAGYTGRDLRKHAVAVLRNTTGVMQKLLAIRVGRFADFFSGVLGNPVLIDGPGFVETFLPEGLPHSIEGLKIPFSVVATDFHSRAEVVFTFGPLTPALAGSMAIPGLVRPVEHQGHVLVDAAAVNPLPFDRVRATADVVLAVDVSGGAATNATGVPNPIDALIGTFGIMQQVIVGSKLAAGAPDLVIAPRVEVFNVLDFFRVTTILKAAEPAKDEVKRKLDPLLA